MNKELKLFLKKQEWQKLAGICVVGLSYRMVALMLCYNSLAPSTCKDISASAICHLYRFS